MAVEPTTESRVRIIADVDEAVKRFRDLSGDLAKSENVREAKNRRIGQSQVGISILALPFGIPGGAGAIALTQIFELFKDKEFRRGLEEFRKILLKIDSVEKARLTEKGLFKEIDQLKMKFEHLNIALGKRQMAALDRGSEFGENPFLSDPKIQEITDEMIVLRAQIKLLGEVLEQLGGQRLFLHRVEERVRKEVEAEFKNKLEQCKGGLDLESLEKQTEEFKKFQETGGASVENLGMQVQKLVADTEHSFGKLPKFAQQAMGKVEGLFGKSLGQMANRWFGFIRQLVSGAQAGGRGILEGLFGGLFGILGGGRRSARSSGGIGFPNIFGGIFGMGTPPFILNFAGSGTVSSVGTVSQSGAGEIPKALGGATQGPHEEYRLAA